jgi:hypothetical protein
VSNYDPDLSVDISNRINEIMRTLPAETSPSTVLTALCAVMARLLRTLHQEDRANALAQAMQLIKDHADIKTS